MSDGVELRSVQRPRSIGDRLSLTLGSRARGNGCLREARSAQSALDQSLLAGPARASLTPAVATFAEQGYPALVSNSWVGAFAPTGTSRVVVEKLSTTIAASLQMPELRQTLVRLGYEPTGTSADELAAIMAADTARWAPIVKASGIRGD